MIANTGDVALTAPQLNPTSGRCFSGDVLLSGLYELVGIGDASFDPGEVIAKLCRGYAPGVVAGYTDEFYGTALSGGGPVGQTASSVLNVVASPPATPTAPNGGWPAPPLPPPAPATAPGLSFEVKAYGPASVNAGDPVTARATIANTGTVPLYIFEFAATSGPCTDTTKTVLTQIEQIHGNGLNGLTLLEPGEMFGATCSGYADASYSPGARVRGRVVAVGGGAKYEQNSNPLSIAILPNPNADMTVDINAPSSVPAGQSLALTRVVENTGLIPLTLASVTPDAPCPGTETGPLELPGDGDGDSDFEHGEKRTLTCTFTPDGSVNPITDGVTAVADIPAADGGGSLTRTATKAVGVVVDSRIEIEVINPPKTGPAGQPVSATSEITNPGNTALGVTAPTQCPPVASQFVVGDSDAALEPGEVWRFACTLLAPSTTDPITTTFTVHATDPAGTAVQDSFSFPFDPLTNGTGGTPIEELPAQPVAAGVTVGTNTVTTPADPIGTEITSPYGTTISIIETTVLTTEAVSAGFLGFQVDIHLDPSTPGSSAANPLPATTPLRVVFYIDQSIFGNGGQIYRDGIAIPMPPNCLVPGVANPEPCIESRVPTANGVKLTVLAVHASSWNFKANAAAVEPVVTITRPADGASYLLGEPVTADFACSPDQLLACVGDAPNGTAVPTGAAALGPQGFTVTATVLGGTGARTNHYSVSFGFGGFASPVDNLPVVNGAKAGSAIPVKFQLRDASGGSAYPLAGVGLNVLDGAPASVRIVCGSSTVDELESYTDITQNGQLLTYDPGSKLYQFVWKTAKTWSSPSGGPCRRLTVKLRDGTTHTADFKFK